MWLGRMITDSTRLMKRAQATTHGNMPRRSPIWPLMKVSGRKATMLVSTVATTGQKTSSVPLIAATSAGSSRSWRAVMFSATTIASSTRRPSTTISPNMVRRLSVIPTAYMKSSVPLSAVARPTPTHHAVRQLRKSSRVAMTRRPPHRALRSSRSRRPSMKRARSELVVRLHPAGSGVRSSAPRSYARRRIERFGSGAR